MTLSVTTIVGKPAPAFEQDFKVPDQQKPSLGAQSQNSKPDSRKKVLDAFEPQLAKIRELLKNQPLVRYRPAAFEPEARKMLANGLTLETIKLAIQTSCDRKQKARDNHGDMRVITRMGYFQGAIDQILAFDEIDHKVAKIRKLLENQPLMRYRPAAFESEARKILAGGVSLETIERAIWIGLYRKQKAHYYHSDRELINSMRYFQGCINEIQAVDEHPTVTCRGPRPRPVPLRASALLPGLDGGRFVPRDHKRRRAAAPRLYTGSSMEWTEQYARTHHPLTKEEERLESHRKGLEWSQKWARDRG